MPFSIYKINLNTIIIYTHYDYSLLKRIAMNWGNYYFEWLMSLMCTLKSYIHIHIQSEIKFPFSDLVQLPKLKWERNKWIYKIVLILLLQTISPLFCDWEIIGFFFLIPPRDFEHIPIPSPRKHSPFGNISKYERFRVWYSFAHVWVVS